MPDQRQQASAAEAKALAHPIRLRILRLCNDQEYTNQELAERLGRDPATILHHVRMLVGCGFLEQGSIRTGARGALEKPYRSTGRSWTLDFGVSEAEAEALAPIWAFQEELTEAGHQSLAQVSRFHLHLTDDDREELTQELLAILDRYMATDDQRRDDGAPGYGGIMALHRLADQHS